jgi:hypothetical protein
VGRVFVLALAAAFNPTLVTATTVMLILPNPKRLMLGYLAGALMTSTTLGLIIVFALEGSGAASTTQHALSPAADLALGGIALTIAFVLGTGRPARVAQRRSRKSKKDKKPPRWQQAVSRGSPRTTFVIGAMLTLPGASYLAGLARINALNYGVPATVVTVVGFNLVMLILIEAPLLSFAVAPEWTPAAIERMKAWIGRHGRRFAVYGFSVIGTLLVAKGVAGLL